MTAAELYEIVKDVPRAAWGELNWIGKEFVDNATDEYVRPKRATNELIGSMTAWLASNDWMPKCDKFHDGARVVLYDGLTHKASSLVAALAAACKEAA